MSDRAHRRPLRPESAEERRDLQRLLDTLRDGAVRPTRRDLMRWSAIASGAVMTARYGLRAAVAAPGRPGGIADRRYQDDEIETDVEISVPFDPYGVDVTLDPHRTTNFGAFWVMFPNVWGGLLRYNELGAVENDLAETFTKSDDGTVYTFKLRPDAKYANGSPVLADHFITSWKRAIDPDVSSPMADFMRPVKGAEAYLNKESEEIGFQALDDATVEITLEKPINYFLSYLAAFVWAVVDPAVLDAEGEEGFVLADAGTGPWRFTEFDPDLQLVMEPNENYYNGVNPSIAKIVWPIVTGPTAAATILDMYKSDDAVSADVPLSLLEQVEGDPELAEQLVKIEPSGWTRAIAMDFKQPPFDNVLVRRAVAQAVDRDAWANDIYQGTYTPTTSFIPPVVSETSNYEPPEGLDFDEDAAREQLADADFEDGEGLPEIVYYQSADDPQEEIDAAAALLQMIEEHSGIAIEHDTSKTQDQIVDLRLDNGGLQFDIVSWQTITETAQLLSFAGRTDSQYMAGYYNWNADLEGSGDFTPGDDAKQFDELTADADVEQDEDKRDDLYQQAEELLLKNAVYVPLGNWVPMYVQKPSLQGTRQGSWTGRLPVLFDKDVVVIKQEDGDGQDGDEESD
jgi:ABC-type transport system substrate-binding protein